MAKDLEERAKLQIRSRRRGVIKHIALAFVTISTVIAILAYLKHAHELKGLEAMDMAAQRDFSRLPFDMIDATFFCQERTEEKYGEQLAQSYVDDHSTRVDDKTGIFKVFMVAHVGTLDNYEETSVHCHIDPYSRRITQYRTINLHESSFMARALKFFD